MARNNLQTFDTPAADKNAQYFSWDLSMRTVSNLMRTDSTLSHPSEEYIDACSRASLITSLLLDERPGYLSQMVEATYPGYNPGGQPPMSNEIILAAEDVQAAARECTAAFDWVPDIPNAIGTS